MLHNKVLTYRETRERSPLRQLVLGLCSQTQAESPDTHRIRPNYKKRKRKLFDTLERVNQKPVQTGMLFGPKQRILSCRLPDRCGRSKTNKILDHVQTQWAQPGSHRQTWLPREESLCTHCTQQEVETDLHFLTTCQMYHQRQILPTDYTQKDFENIVTYKMHSAVFKDQF